MTMSESETDLEDELAQSTANNPFRIRLLKQTESAWLEPEAE